MNSIILPTVQKSGSNSLLASVLLILVLCAICYVVYWMGKHQHRTRKAKKSGQSPHDGRHGNH